MPRYDDPDEPFYFGEVIGSALSYHRPTCHIIRLIEPRNYKRLRGCEEAATLGLKPCPHCRPPVAWNQDDDANKPESDQPHQPPITATQIADRRRQPLRLLDELETVESRPERESVGERIGRLTRNNVIPRIISACMRMITEMRNAAEYENKQFSANETQAIEAVWLVIQEWANTRRDQ
jgi:hypothetical protein